MGIAFRARARALDCYEAIVLVCCVLRVKYWSLEAANRDACAGVQFVFFFLYGNMQVALAFLLSCFFRDTRTANVTCWIWVLGAGLISRFLLEPLFAAGQWWVIPLELIPTFGAYRCASVVAMNP